MKKLLLGLLGGLSLGMLFAPKKGEEMRESMAKSDNKMKTFADGLGEMAQNASAEVQEYLKTPEAQELIAKGKTVVTDTLNTTKSLSETAQKELKTLMTTAEEKSGKIIADGKKAAKKAINNMKS